MRTTNLFVELMVIGVGAAAVVLMAALTVFGTGWVPLDRLLAVQTVVPALAVTYVLGIVADRLADQLLDPLSERWRRAEYGDDLQDVNYHSDRRIILAGSDQLASILQYDRSRIRVVRGWIVNGLLLLVAGAAFIWDRPVDADLRFNLLLFYISTMLLVSSGCFFAWRKLMKRTYLSMREGAEFLRERDNQASSS